MEAVRAVCKVVHSVMLMISGARVARKVARLRSLGVIKGLLENGD